MRNKKFVSLLMLFISIFTVREIVSAQKGKAPPIRTVVSAPPDAVVAAQKNLSPELKRRLETFNLVWQTIKNNYFDQTFNGLDWNKIRQEYEPRVLKTTTDSQLHDILTEMINRLERSHFAVIPPEVYQAIEKAKTEAREREKKLAANEKGTPEEKETDENYDFEDFLKAKFGVSIELRLIDNQFIITRVKKDSAAERAGLKTGYSIERVNDVSLVELLQKLQIYYSKVRNINKYLPAEVVKYMLNGEQDSVVTISYSNGIEIPKTIAVQREKLKGETISIGKNYPEQFLQFESSSLNDEVGYVKFNLFAVPVIEKFCAALTDLKDKKAIIVDLRGNSGGIIGSMIALGGMLTDKSINLGTSIYKVGSENFIAASKAKNYTGKLVFLVDNQTVSAAEIFSAALQENNRAVIVGERTAGEALPSVSVKLPTGAVLQYPIANFKTRNGNLIEGKGVEPNVVADLDRKSLLEGKDNQLETALRVIREDKAFPKELEGIATRIGSVQPPPPPPPMPKALVVPQGKQLGEVNIKIPNPAPLKEVYKKDEKALQIIADFINKIGGEEAFNKINSYTLKGSTEINVRGTTADLGINIFRQKPDRYAEIMNSDVTGEVRTVYDSKGYFVQSDFGLTEYFPIAADISKVEVFAPLNALLKKDVFKSLTYQGVFDRQGRKTHIIEAKTAEGASAALAFDVETKLLVSFVVQYYAVSYGDYRPVENVLLPFHIERENLMNIDIEKIKLNSAIEESNFTKKENCFDKTN